MGPSSRVATSGGGALAASRASTSAERARASATRSTSSSIMSEILPRGARVSRATDFGSGGAVLARGGGAQGGARLVAALVHRPVVTLVLFPEVLRGGRRGLRPIAKQRRAGTTVGGRVWGTVGGGGGGGGGEGGSGLRRAQQAAR